MTPRNNRTGEISWDGVENLIREYDLTVIIPREIVESKRLSEVEKTLSEWTGSIKVILWIIVGLLVPTLGGIVLLVWDLIKWGVTTGWQWTAK
jgi:hypothetical protein